MEYIHWYGGMDFCLYLLILCIPLFVYALKYGRAVSDCQKYMGCILNPYLTNRFRWWGKGAIDEEANKHWDKALKGTKFQYKAFGLFHGKEVDEFQRGAHKYRVTNWNKFNYPILNANIGNALFNIAMFGFFAYPMGFALLIVLLQKGLRDIHPVTSPAVIAFILIVPIIICRCRKLKKATADIIASGQQPEGRDNVGDYQTAWERRGSIMNKILIKYFGGNEEEMVAYAQEDHSEAHYIAYTKICKNRNSEWTLEPSAEYISYSDGDKDRNLLMGVLLVGTIVVVATIGLLQLSFLLDIVNMFFKAIGSLLSLPTRI